MVSEVKLPLHLASPPWLAAFNVGITLQLADASSSNVLRATKGSPSKQITFCRRADDGRHRDETRRHPASEIDARRVYGHWQ